MSEKFLSQEQCFPQHEVAMIDDFNQTLRRIGINMIEDDQGANNYLYHTLGAAFNNAMSPGAVTDATKRVFLAEIAGASQKI